MYYHSDFRRSRSNSNHVASSRRYQKLRSICALSLGMGHADPLNTRPFPTLCCHAEFGRSTSDGVETTRVHPTLARLHGPAPWVGKVPEKIGMPHPNPLLPTWVTLPNLIVVCQKVRTYVWRFAGN